MRTSEVLNKAADKLQECGWRQGPSGWGGSPSGLCLEGAIAAAAGLNVSLETVGNGEMRALWDCPAYNAVHNYLNRETGRYLWSWNDASERTAEEVIETLRACALIEVVKEEEALLDGVQTTSGVSAQAQENQSIENKEEVSA